MTKHSENTKLDTCDNAVLANRLLEFNLWDIDRQQYFTDVLTLKRDAICKWATLEKRTSNNIIWLQFTGFFDIFVTFDGFFANIQQAHTGFGDASQHRHQC